MKYQQLMAGVMMAALTACTTTQPIYQKPVVTKNAQGVPSHHLVRQGETVSQIAQRYGLNWRDVAQINRLDNSNTIYAGQWLLLWRGSNAQSQRAATHTPSPTTQALSTPAPSRVVIVQNHAKNQPKTQQVNPSISTQSQPRTNATSPPAPQSGSPKTAVINDTGNFIHPVKGATVAREFGTVRQINGTNVKTEGVWFSAKEGDPINASRAGTVIYADANSMPDASIAIRHADGFVTEYRFIKDSAIKAGQNVQAGQRIASVKSINGVAVMEFRVAKNHVYLDPVSVLK